MSISMMYLRTMEGPARRAACRAHLFRHAGLTFDQSATDLTSAQRAMLQAMAKAVSWKRPMGCMLALAPAYYAYLAKDMHRGAHQVAQAARQECTA